MRRTMLRKVKQEFFLGLEFREENEVDYLVAQLQEQTEKIKSMGWSEVYLVVKALGFHARDEPGVEGYLVGERWEEGGDVEVDVGADGEYRTAD